jgi:LAS superfamily LD-carboxypeptidase LdcB
VARAVDCGGHVAGDSTSTVRIADAALEFSRPLERGLGGRAVDVATPGCRPLTEEFELTPAFAWLVDNAGRFGFAMPYGRNNAYGLSYEPWHWSQLD